MDPGADVDWYADFLDEEEDDQDGGKRVAGSSSGILGTETGSGSLFDVLGQPPSPGTKLDRPLSPPSLDEAAFGVLLETNVNVPNIPLNEHKDTKRSSEPVSAIALATAAPKHDKTGFKPRNGTPNTFAELNSETMLVDGHSRQQRKRRNRQYVDIETSHNYAELPTNTIRYQVAISSNGQRLYFPKRRDEDIIKDPIAVSTNESRLPGSNIHSLIERVKREMAAYKATAAKKRSTEQLAATTSEATIDVTPVAVQQVKDDFSKMNDTKKKSVVAKVAGNTLWVDRFRPRRYVDLIGNERLNRRVLHWIKQWDYCVFKKETPADRAANNVDDSQFKFRQRFNNRLKLPEKTMLMISGPAGLGKTTLAHVIAEHCGYYVQEMNASDDRTGSQQTLDKLEGALLTQNVTTKRPTCLIIDEIDGADGSFIRGLLRLTQPQTAQQNGKKKEGYTKSGRNDSLPLARRPVICICNDAYAQALRPLRGIVEHVRITMADCIEPVTQRLRDICNDEGIDIGPQTLTELAEDAGGDIRSCLNTLQYLCGQVARQESNESDSKKPLSLKESIEKGNLIIPYKDRNQNLWDTLRSVFVLPTSKQAARKKTSRNEQRRRLLLKVDRQASLGQESSAKDVLGGLSKDSASATDFILDEVRACDDLDILVQACYEHYLQSWIFDTSRTWPQGKPTMNVYGKSTRPSTKIESSLDWLVFYDTLESTISRTMDFRLSKYLPFAVVKMHTSFASVGQIDTWFPRLLSEIRNERRATTELLYHIREIMDQSIRPSYTSNFVVRRDLIPYIPFIVSPDMRQANVHLLKPVEKRTLGRVVEIMVSLGLKFVPSEHHQAQQQQQQQQQRQQQHGSEAKKDEPEQHSSVVGPDSGELRLEPDIIGFLRKLDSRTPACMMLVGRKLLARSQDMMKQTMNGWIVRERIRRLHEREEAFRTAAATTAASSRLGVSVQPGTPSSGKRMLDDGRSPGAVMEAAKRAAKKRLLELVPTPRKIDATRKRVARDFFGRVIAEEPISGGLDGDNEGDSGDEDAARVSYVYHEGFSNAVRRPFVVRELFM